MLPALGAGSNPALGLGVEILPGGTVRGEGDVAAVMLRVTCSAQDGAFTGSVMIVQGAARGTRSLRGGCSGIGQGVIEAAIPADRSARRPGFLRGAARASVRLSPSGPLGGGAPAADSGAVQLR